MDKTLGRCQRILISLFCFKRSQQLSTRHKRQKRALAKTRNRDNAEWRSETAKPPIHETTMNQEEDPNPQIDDEVSDPEEEPIGSKELR